MPDHIHGHEVMKMMIEAGQPYTKATLRTAIVDRFGQDATFYTCSAKNMTPDELTAIVDARGKFIGADDTFTTDPDKICKH